MKMTKLTFPMMLALAALLAATGCKHGPTKVTALPGERNVVGGGDPTPVGGKIPGEENPNPGGPGGGNQGNRDIFDDMIKDPAALASYTVHFAFDSSVVKSAEQIKVSAVAAQLSSHPANKLLIEGNCDERGTEEYNRALGERRALALREALAKAGIDPLRIRTLSNGKDKPVDTGKNEAAWAKNRRGDFILLLPKT